MKTWFGKMVEKDDVMRTMTVFVAGLEFGDSRDAEFVQPTAITRRDAGHQPHGETGPAHQWEKTGA